MPLHPHSALRSTAVTRWHYNNGTAPRLRSLIARDIGTTYDCADGALQDDLCCGIARHGAVAVLRRTASGGRQQLTGTAAAADQAAERLSCVLAAQHISLHDVLLSAID